MQEPSPLKQVKAFTFKTLYEIKQIFVIHINKAILGWDDSKLKSPKIIRSKSPTDHPVDLGDIDCFVIGAFKYLQITTSHF